MMEDRIDELEKLKSINKKRKIVLIILVIVLILITVDCNIQFVGFLLAEDDCAVWGFSEQEIEAYNSKFTSYIGNQKTGVAIKQLCSTINTNNINYAGDESRLVYIKMGDITGLDTREKWRNSEAVCSPNEIVTIRNQINSARRYDVTAVYDEKGMIMGIGVIEASSSATTQNITNTNNI